MVMEQVTIAGFPEHTGFASSGYQAGGHSGELAQLKRLLGASREEAEEELAASSLRLPARCPRCGQDGAGFEGRRRYRCASCRAVFGLFDGRWLSRRSITPHAWLVTLKGFELGLSGQQISGSTGLSMPTVYKTLETIRMALACLDPRWEGLVGVLEESQGRSWPGMFGIKESEGRVSVETLEGGAPWGEGDALPPVLHAEGFVYTAGYGEFDALVWHGPIAGGQRAAGGRREALANPFLRFLLSHTAKHCGIPSQSFPLYLKEYELRFNHRGRPLFERLLSAITRPRPARMPAES